MYKYERMKEELFTDAGQRKFLELRDKINLIIQKSGCIRLGEAVSQVSGDSFLSIACIDRMVELGELDEIKFDSKSYQQRIFVKPL